jgi:molecular chaperone GrpE
MVDRHEGAAAAAPQTTEEALRRSRPAHQGREREPAEREPFQGDPLSGQDGSAGAQGASSAGEDGSAGAQGASSAGEDGSARAHGGPAARQGAQSDPSEAAERLEDAAEAVDVAASGHASAGNVIEVEPDQDEGAEPAEHERVTADLEELAARAGKADEYLELAQRTRADFENYKRRAVREAALAQERGIAKLVKELLPAIDNLDRAVQATETFTSADPDESAAAAESQLVSGIRLVFADVLSALSRVGIEPFSPVGEPFDPQWHEAVAQQPIEGAQAGTVVEVYQQGYRLGETVLRPARVLVAG